MSDLLDRLPDAVVALDAERRLEYVNRAAVDLLGYAPEELVGRSADEVLHPRGRDGKPVWAYGWPRAAYLASVDVIPEQGVRVRTASGDDLMVAVTGRYRRDDQGRLCGAVLVLRSVRGRERQEARGIEVVSMVSHELRAPLTSVKGFTSLMLNRWDRLGDEQKRGYLEQIQLDADRVTRLITELLDISRLETGRLKLRRLMVSLGPLIEKVVADVKHLHPELDPDVTVAENLPEVYADPDKIVQVLTNLVENTGKYAGAAGVRVEVREEPEAAEVQVAVSDRGPGIPARDLERIFMRFYRFGEGRPTGSGLGLYIAKGIVESHGGRLWAESVVGEGSTFTFTLPAGVPEDLEIAGDAT